MLETLVPLNGITELTQQDAHSWVIVLTKFNVIFLGMLSLFIAVTGVIRKKFIAIAAPISLAGVFIVDPLGATLGLTNPQQLVVYPLIIVSLTLILQASIRRFRTLARIMMSVVSTAVLVGAILIHLATINIKMDSQARMLAEHNYMMADITFTNKPSDERLFLNMCKSRNLYCRTENTEIMPIFDKFTSENDVRDILRDARLEDRLSSPEENRFVLLTNLDDLYGSEFQVASFATRGIERTIVDFDNVNRFHNQSKNIVYIWVGILSTFWVYGGLYLYYYHERKRKIRKNIG